MERQEKGSARLEMTLAGAVAEGYASPHMMDTGRLPTGTVTFLFTDIEGSTRLLGQLAERYGPVLEKHHRLLRDALIAAGGVEVDRQGDAFFVAFSSAPRAVAGAIEAQRALAAHEWPPDGRVRVRMGLHTGDGQLGGDGYVGIDVHRAARIAAAGHGEQILVSESTRALAAPAGLDGVSFRDLGEHRLKDLPSPEHLFQVIAPRLETEFPAVRTLDARRGNLPVQLTSFVGREQEVRDVISALGRSRLLTLTGAGGTGKTRLALQAAADAQGEHSDGAHFVSLAPIRDPSLVVTTVARSLGLREDPNRQPIETLIEHLHGQHLLLVLDNFEQILEAASHVGELLVAAPGVRVLVTSREPLHLHGEQEYAVPPMRLPDPAELPLLDALSAFEAVQLFVDRARAVDPGFELTEANAPAVAEICVRLDGLPLAIELAAARVKVLDPSAILKRLEHRLTLAGGARDVPARQQTLRDAIAWSHDLLAEVEQRFFARLSVLAGGATLEAIEAVVAVELELDALDAVASLLNKSLVRRTESPSGDARFFMLETIREFATERLDASPDGAAVHARHAAYFLLVAEAAAAELYGPKQADLLDALGQDHDNFRAALAWATSSNELPTALRLAGSLWRFWQMRGHLREAAGHFESILGHPDAERDPAALAIGMEGAGGVNYWMANWEQAERYYARCAELRRSLADPRGLAEALYNLSFVYSVASPPIRDLSRSRALIDEAVAAYREADDAPGEAKSLWAMANDHLMHQEWEASMDAARKALKLFDELEDRFGAAWAYRDIGVAATYSSQLEEAESALHAALDLFSSAGDLPGMGVLMGDISVLEGFRGDHERAARLRGAAFGLDRRSGQAMVSQLDHLLPNVEETVRGPLSQPEFDRLIEAGAALGTNDAVAFALRHDT